MNNISGIKVPMWDKMQVFCKHIADHQVRMVLKFNRTLNDVVLKRAIEIAIEKNPIIFAKLVERDKQIFWSFSKMDVVKIFLFKESVDPELILNETILERIDNFTQPQLLITLIRSKQSESDILVLNCNHSISDAGGVKEFMYQLAEIYHQLSQNQPVLELAYSSSRSLKVLSKNLTLKEKMTVLSVTASRKKNASTFNRHLDIEQLQNPGFITYAIVPDIFERIREFGKRNGATINDVFLSLLFSTLKSVLPNDNKTNRLTYASDLRGFMVAGDYDILSNFSSIHNIDIDNSISGFVDLLREISRHTTLRKQKEYCLADFPLMAMLFKVMPFKKVKNVFHKEFERIKEGKCVAAPSLTNMGVIDETKLNFDGIFPIRAYMLGGVNHPNLFQTALSTYKEQLTISIGTYLNEKNKDFTSKFMDELREIIDKEILDSVCINSFGTKEK